MTGAFPTLSRTAAHWMTKKNLSWGFYCERRTGYGLTGLDNSGARGWIMGRDFSQWTHNWRWILSKDTRGARRDAAASSCAPPRALSNFFLPWTLELFAAHFAPTQRCGVISCWCLWGKRRGESFLARLVPQPASTAQQRGVRRRLFRSLDALREVRRR